MSIPLPAAYRQIMTPPEQLSVSEWCDRFRIMSDRYGAEKTNWQTDRTPYLREIMDSFADPAVGTITFIKCSRVGGTEVMYNCLAYSAARRPMPAMVVLPSEGAAQDEFSGRLKSVFEESPSLAALHAPTNWSTVEPPQLSLSTMEIYSAWASAPDTMIRRTIGVIAFDELDNCEAAAGRLGNTLSLVSDRLATFGYRGKLLSATTPTTTMASGWQSYEASDRRQYFVPCPHCGHYQTMTFAGIVVPEEKDGGRDPDRVEAEGLARYQCDGCRQLIEERERMVMVGRGLWVPAAQKIVEKFPVEHWANHAFKFTPRVEGNAPVTRHRGYRINSCYSPWRTWSQIFARFLRAKDDPEKKRVFFNSWMGEPYEETVETASIEILEKRVPDGQPVDMVPSRAKILVAGADVQDEFIYYTLRAWGPGEESWLVRHGFCSTFDELYTLCFHVGFPYGTDAGSRMIASAVAIDSGHRTDEVYSFGKRPGVVVVKGKDWADFRVKPSKVEYTPRGKIHPESIILNHVNTGLFKSKLHRLAGDPDRFHLHRETSREYLQHFTAEALVWIKTKRSGRTVRKKVWKERAQNAPNHWLDCECYGLALADMLNVPLLTADSLPPHVLQTPVLAQPVPPPMSAPAADAPSSPPPNTTAAAPAPHSPQAPRSRYGWRGNGG